MRRSSCIFPAGAALADEAGAFVVSDGGLSRTGGAREAGRPCYLCGSFAGRAFAACLRGPSRRPSWSRRAAFAPPLSGSAFVAPGCRVRSLAGRERGTPTPVTTTTINTGGRGGRGRAEEGKGWEGARRG